MTVRECFRRPAAQTGRGNTLSVYDVFRNFQLFSTAEKRGAAAPRPFYV